MSGWGLGRRRRLIRQFLPGAVKTGVLRHEADWDPERGLVLHVDEDTYLVSRRGMVPLYRIVPEGQEREID